MHIKCEIQCVLGDPPEISMMAHQTSKPGVLKLFGAPQYRHLIGNVTESMTMFSDCRMYIEKGSVRIEDTSLDSGNGVVFRHNLPASMSLSSEETSTESNVTEIQPF
jgi:hypothetical protein